MRHVSGAYSNGRYMESLKSLLLISAMGCRLRYTLDAQNRGFVVKFCPLWVLGAASGTHYLLNFTSGALRHIGNRK